MTARYLTVQEVADKFRRSTRTIHRWIEEKFIREYTRVRDGVLIPEHEVQRILDEGKNKDVVDLKPPRSRKPKVGGFVGRYKK